MRAGVLGSLILVLTNNVALADTRTHNAFMFFEYTLTPIAIKWACGGQRDQDLAALDAMIAANPKDAEEAELASAIKLLVDASKREDGFTEIVGFETTDQQREQLCATALPLSLAPMPSPGQSNKELESDEEAKWAAFYGVIEEWQTNESP